MKIYELRPLNPFIQVCPIACKALHSRLAYLLQHYSTPALTSSAVSVIDDFVVRALYILPTPPEYPDTITTGLIPNGDLKTIYEINSTEAIQWYVPTQGDLRVPRWICSRTTEIFFEGDRQKIQPDTDEMGLASNIIHCLLQLPKDVRAKVMRDILVVGGGAAIPGLRTRLKNTVEALWAKKVGKNIPVQPMTPDGTPPGTSHGIPEKPLSIADLTPRKPSTAF